MDLIGLFFKEKDERVLSAAKEVLKDLENKKYGVILREEQAKAMGRKELGTSDKEFFKNVKFIIAVGGDGTMLRAARLAAPFELPILGVNLGKLGFLTEVERHEVAEVVPKIFKGEYSIDERIMLKAAVVRKLKEVGRLLALNEMVITKSGIARLIKLQVFEGEELVSTYSADGLIVSTPTGATAYNLSAGGPVFDLNVQAMTLTAICSHTLNNRPVVFGLEKEKEPLVIKIVVLQLPEDEQTLLTADGQEMIPLKAEDEVLIQRSEHTTRFIRLKHYRFFEILRSKLGWSA